MHGSRRTRGRDGGEHVLVALELQGSTIDRLRDVMGMQEVLSEETETYPDLSPTTATSSGPSSRRFASNSRRRMSTSERVGRGDGTETCSTKSWKRKYSLFSGTRFVLTNGITEVEDAKQMARFFRGVDDWPLSSDDAVTLGVDTDRAELADGWCQEFLDEYEDTQSLRAEDLLTQTVQRGGTYRGTPQESISALLITLATANKIALRRDDEYITEPDEIGRAVRNKTNLTDVLIRFESLDGIDPDQIREAVETLIGEEPDGTEPDAWLSELATWVDENSVLVKRVLRGVSREFGEGASLDELETASSPHSGANLSKQTTLRPTKSHVSPSVSLGQEHSSGRWRIAIPSGSSSASERRRCSGSTPVRTSPGRCKTSSAGTKCLMPTGFGQQSTKLTLTDEPSSVSSTNGSRENRQQTRSPRAWSPVSQRGSTLTMGAARKLPTASPSNSTV